MRENNWQSIHCIGHDQKQGSIHCIDTLYRPAIKNCEKVEILIFDKLTCPDTGDNSWHRVPVELVCLLYPTYKLVGHVNILCMHVYVFVLRVIMSYWTAQVLFPLVLTAALFPLSVLFLDMKAEQYKNTIKISELVVFLVSGAYEWRCKM